VLRQQCLKAIEVRNGIADLVVTSRALRHRQGVAFRLTEG
jgi:hypothetical protein